MPKARYLQTTFASGEFDPLLLSREDVAFYYSSAFLLENVVPLPQGGAKRREGLRAGIVQRGLLTAIDMSGYTYTAPNGGTPALVLSDAATPLVTTGPIGTTAEYVVSQWDAGSDQRVSMVDVQARLSGSSEPRIELALQWSPDDVNYSTVASFNVGNAYQERRFALAPNVDLATARYFRIVALTGGTDHGAAVIEAHSLGSFSEAGWSQPGAEPGARKLRKITASITSEYWAVITDRNCDILTSAGAFQAAVPLPHADAVVGAIKTSQNLDTLVLYQEDTHPHIVQRLDMADDQWRGGLFPIEDVTLFPFEDATTGGQNEIQEANFSSMSAGDRVQFEFNGEVSAEVSFSSTPATNVTNFKAALEGMRDFTEVTVTHVGNDDYTIEFVGDDALKFFATLVVVLLDGSGTVTITRRQPGRPHQEALWSPDRGYARCGTFYQGGHWMGGFKARPDAIVRSRLQAFGDFREDDDPVATSPLLLLPDIDEQVTVENIYPGRSLQIFTSSAEIFIPDEPITPNNVALKVSSKRGCQTDTQPVDVQGGTMFVDRNGTNLREYLFQEVEQSYTAEPISTLGGHLVQKPKELALRRSVDTDEPTILYVVNTGRNRQFEKVPTASVTIDRAQQVTGFARIETAGDVLGAAATQGGDVAFMVRRELSGNAWNFLEFLDSDHMSDHSFEVANTELDAFTATEGQTVFAYTFASPAIESDLGVFARADGDDKWVRVEADDYTLDTGAGTVTLDTGLEAGVEVRIAARQTSFNLPNSELNGIECYVHADGRAVGAHTPVGGSVTIQGSEGFWLNARIGLRMVPRIILQAYKGQGDSSPTMERQRIFRALLNVERTSDIAIGMQGGPLRPVPLTNIDSGVLDRDLEEVLFTGTKRISGMGKWEVEPRIEISQTEPGPFLLRSIAYDIRF